MQSFLCPFQILHSKALLKQSMCNIKLFYNIKIVFLIVTSNPRSYEMQFQNYFNPGSQTYFSMQSRFSAKMLHGPLDSTCQTGKQRCFLTIIMPPYCTANSSFYINGTVTCFHLVRITISFTLVQLLLNNNAPVNLVVLILLKSHLYFVFIKFVNLPILK